MIEPFCLHEGSKDSAQAEAMRKEQPWKITDEELSTFEEKVKTDTKLRLYIQLHRHYHVLVWFYSQIRLKFIV